MKGLRLSLWVGLLLLNVFVGVLNLLAPTLQIPIPASVIMPEVGDNFIATIAIVPRFPYVYGWDTPADPIASESSITENGGPLGPPHSAHEDIRSKGAGRFSFWSGAIYFSSSDGSDPRSNGRTYAARVSTRLPRRVPFSLLVLDFFGLFAVRRTIARWCLRHSRMAITVAVVFALAMATVRVFSAIVGWTSPVFGGSAAAINRSMAIAIAGHVLLGFGLWCVTYATGVGALLWIGRRQRSLADLLLRAFLPGTIVLGLAALLAITLPGGNVFAFVACAIAAAPLARFRPGLHDFQRALRPPMFCAPVVVFYAIVLSFRFHGPSATLAGAPLGDEAIYVGWAHMLSQHLMPLFNYANEGFRNRYGNLLPSLFLSPFLNTRWFDPYLFLDASLPILSLTSLCTTVPLLSGICRPRESQDTIYADLLLFAGLSAGALRFPSTIVESPPFIFLLPLIVSTVYVCISRPGTAGRLWEAVATATVGTAISKVVALPVIGLLPIPQIARQLFARSHKRWRLLAALVGAAVLAYLLIVLRTYLPFFSHLGGLGPDSWAYLFRYHVTDPVTITFVLARDLGAVLLALSVTKCSWLGLKLGIWAGVSLGLLMPFLFHTSLSTAVMMTALACLGQPHAFAGARRYILLAAALMLPQTILAEYGGLAVSLIWIAVVASLTLTLIPRGALVIVASGASRLYDRLQRRLLAVPALFTVFSSLVLWVAAVGAVHVSPLAAIYTSEMHDIWRAVRRMTPGDALIFTDQTGDVGSRTEGWNDFALAAERQFYIVSWATSPLRIDAELRRAWLGRNAAVLSGELNPTKLYLSRSYDGYYAVLERNKHPFAGATLIYVNKGYALYRLAEIH